jgi:hypothetical protein
MSLTLDERINKAHAEAERVEDDARQLEARIIKAGGIPPVRPYGKSVDANAIASNLTLKSILQRRDPELANYFGCGSDYRRKQDEAAALKAEISSRMAAETERVRKQNQLAQTYREQCSLAGVNSHTRRRLGT